MTRKPAFAPHSTYFEKHKKAIWPNLLSIQMKQSHQLLCVAKESWLIQENHASVKLDSSVASRGMKTYSESRIELWNLQMLKKMLAGKCSGRFSHHSSPVTWKAWKLPWILQELKKYARKTYGCGQHWRSFNSNFWMKGALTTVKIFVLCGWSFLNHFNHLKVSNCKDLTCLLTLFRVDQINCIDICSILACKALSSTASGSGDSCFAEFQGKRLGLDENIKRSPCVWRQLPGHTRI